MLKQVILVPMWLGMSPGKVASQCCHVTAMVVEGLLMFSLPLPEVRIILRAQTKKEMAILWHKAIELDTIRMWRFKDRAPTTEGTESKFTAYSFVGQYDNKDLDALTGHLELY